MFGASSNQHIWSAKQEERERLIRLTEENLRTYDQKQDDEILDASPEGIVERLKAGGSGWTCQKVMEAYIRAAIRAHRATNCLTEIMFETALEEARAKDQQKERGEELVGAFWGLPSSFKDTYNIIDVDTSLGCSPHCGDPTTNHEDEGGLVKLFRKAGGIPFCKTNVPQTLLAFESKNPVFGRTLNPFDHARTPGGSSGGEAALVSLKGTPVGWGSDIGGSLRIPAHYSGCLGFKPVIGRWPLGGSRKVTAGFDAVRVCVGPIARTVADLKFASKTMINLAQDPASGLAGENIMPIPWRDVDMPERLKIGYFIETGGVKTSPACARAVIDTVHAIRKMGHEVEFFTPPDPIEAMKCFVGLTSADGYKSLLSNIGKDPMEPSMTLVTLGSKLPRLLHRFACWTLQAVLGDTTFAETFAASKPKSVSDFWHWIDRRDEFAAELNKLMWNTHKFDAVICPVQAVPALEHDRTADLSPLAVATILWNICEATVGVLPVTRVDRNLDQLPTDFLQDSIGSWILAKRLYGGSDPAYNADKTHNLAVGVQVVGQCWEEEKVLKVMELVEQAVGFV